MKNNRGKGKGKYMLNIYYFYVIEIIFFFCKFSNDVPCNNYSNRVIKAQFLLLSSIYSVLPHFKYDR